jgi:heme iron utilization protein
MDKTAGVVQEFRTRHPSAAYAAFDDFYAFCFHPERIRYIGGFGEMSWVDARSFASARPDPVSKDVNAVQGAVSHMNADHADANLLLVNKFGRLPRPADAAVMLSIDRYGMDFLAETPDGKRRVRVGFAAALNSADEIKAAVVDATKRAKM